MPITSTSPKDYDLDEVCLWLHAIGLGNSSTLDAFRDNAVDGDLLVTLTQEDLTQDLGLTNLQAKKVIQKLEFSKALAANSSDDASSSSTGGADAQRVHELQEETEKLHEEIATLKAELEQYKNPPKEEQEEKPPPKQEEKPKPKNQHEVARGAAGGAARGAVVGAVAGAVAGDAAKGAKIGAATGATAGGMRGIRAKRHHRLGR